MTLKKRRMIYRTVFLIILIGSFYWYLETANTFVNTSIYTGWSLCALMLLLACYNLRKKLTTLPLGGASLWMQVHIYSGLMTAPLYLYHTSFSLPNGQLEITLAILYFIVFISGVVGLFINRTFPRRLTARGEEVIFERIPATRHHVVEEVEKLLLDSAKKEDSTCLVDFYKKHLLPYFSRPNHLFSHVFESSRPRAQLLATFEDQKRYLSSAEKVVLEKLWILTERKYHLDYSYALQSCLKYWLFIHVPFTYSLLVFTALHVYVVYAFTGGLN